MASSSTNTNTPISESTVPNSSDTRMLPKHSTLNPSAQEWKPVMESRMLFMTFSRGCPPVNEQEVASFFTKRYGDCVNYVYINRSQQSGMEFGSIVFKSSIYPALVLGNQEDKMEHIGATPVCFKWYKRDN